jgi:protein-S-isoprenylcysteine O-methyltransferase Ste14
MIAAAAAFAIACRLQVVDEERLLAVVFGGEYDRYRVAVRRWL